MSFSLTLQDVDRGFAVHRPRQAGAALVIVLAFVVLLTGLMVAYFARSITARQLSNSSAGGTRSALLAQSASDIIIAGLKKEIVQGSTLTTVGTGATQSNIYVPTVPANMVPARYFTTPAPTPNTTPADLIPNLVRVSVSDDTSNSTFPTRAVPSLASVVNSATAPAINGRVITTARWNSHYLIPSYDAVASLKSPSPTPASSPDSALKFIAPDWVLVTRAGPEKEPDVKSNAINNPISTNNHYVIGRYAYAIYDEGGLLDMNAAGYPFPSPSPTPSATAGFTSVQLSRKGSLAMADLTQLPVVKTPAVPAVAADYLTIANVNSIVGWRNYASSNPGLYYPSFSFSAAQAGDWFTNFASKNTSGFLKAYSGPVSSGTPVATDQAFLSRQQLLRLQNSIGFSPNALQFMGTFSRGLEQPSFVPDPSRPRIITKNLDPSPYPTLVPDPSVAAPSPPTPVYDDSYLGNNDAVGADDIINPSFLTVRVQGSSSNGSVGFTRLNGTAAVVGEPLVKTKFPLSRLGQIKYDLTCPKTTGGNHIWDYFGLSRTSNTTAWTYDHGSTHIMTLAEVSTAGREPDFAELLKAAINVGSLGKGGPNLNNGQGNYQYGMDVSVDFQVLQIMANLIDQYDTDSYPTIIQVNFSSPGGTTTRNFRGVEDLPYIYRYHTMGVMSVVPTTLLTAADKVTFYTYDKDAANKRGALVGTINYCKPGTLSSPGEGDYLFVLGVWNPHTAAQTSSTPSAPPGPRPTQFRVVAVTNDPLGADNISGASSNWLAYAKTTFAGALNSDIPDLKTSIFPAAEHLPMTETRTAMIFKDNNGKLFREPTLLWRPEAPTGANLTADTNSLAGPYTDVNTSGYTAPSAPIQYMGMFLGKTPLDLNEKISASYIAADPTDSTGNTNLAQSTMFIFQPANTMTYGVDFPAGSTQFNQITFRLEYPDPNDGHWVVYNEDYPDLHQVGQPNLAINKAETAWANSKWANPMSPTNLNQMNAYCNVYDPRTPRFGVGTSGTHDNIGLTNYVLEPIPGAYYNQTTTDLGNTKFGQSHFTIFQTQRPTLDVGQYVYYSNPGMTTNPGRNKQMRFFSGLGYSASNGDPTASNQYDGIWAQNDPSILVKSHNGANGATTQIPFYYEDPDGIPRRAMGAYADTPLGTNSYLPAMGTLTYFGQPLATNTSYVVNPTTNFGVGTPDTRTDKYNLNRPLILNRPFQSVGEMSYTFRGTAWKQIDFFTPESADTALLDVFCVNEPPSDGIVAGKVNLNTHQVPVLQAMLANTSRDELKNLTYMTTPSPDYRMPALDSLEANNIAKILYGVTTNTTTATPVAWRGPLANIAQLVGHFVANPGTTTGAKDIYSYPEPLDSRLTFTYAGFSALLDNTAFTSAATATTATQTPRIQRLRESAIRALSDAGQTRVWNLMIDVVAQTGRYSPNAANLNQFSVDGEQRCWVHVAIDRMTGEVIDKQIEVVTE